MEGNCLFEHGDWHVLKKPRLFLAFDCEAAKVGTPYKTQHQFLSTTPGPRKMPPNRSGHMLVAEPLGAARHPRKAAPLLFVASHS